MKHKTVLKNAQKLLQDTTNTLMQEALNGDNQQESQAKVIKEHWNKLWWVLVISAMFALNSLKNK